MAVFNWKLFGDTIAEEIGVDSFLDEREVPNHWRLEDEVEKNDEEPARENDEYTISDAVLEAYYVATLREIYTQEQCAQEPFEDKRQEQLQRLNEMDELLNLWVSRGKALVLSWEKRCAGMPRQQNEELENAVVQYAEEVWHRTKQSEWGTDETLTTLSEEILQNVRFQQSDVEDNFAWRKLRRFLRYLNRLVKQPLRNPKIEKKIRTQLCDLPMYLGTPYAQRHAFYKEVRRYKSLVRADDNFEPLGAIHMMMFDSRFEEYSAKSSQKAAKRIADKQDWVCQKDVIQDLPEWKNKCDALKSYLDNMGVLTKEYVKGKRCFAIIDVTLQAEEQQYLCFSGVFDSPDPNIQKRFDYADPNLPQNKKIVKLKEKILKIAQKTAETIASNTAGQPVRTALITANENIRYYYDETDKKKNVTLKQFCAKRMGSLRSEVRMFSCCERKFFTKLETFPLHDVKIYKMYIKYEPCWMCLPAIDDFQQKGYRSNIIYGYDSKGSSDIDDPKYKKYCNQLARNVAN